MSGETFYVGVDLGGTKIHLGIANADRFLVAERNVPTPAGGAGALIEAIGAAVDEMLRELDADTSQLLAIGLGGAGVPAPDGGFADAPNLGDVDHDIPAALSARLGCPAVIDNDVNVAALGELVSGRIEPDATFAFIAIGTGIGMGFVLDGQLVRGARMAAGEIGYLPFGADPLDERNHVRGALEEVVAGSALLARDHAAASTREVFERAARGIPSAVSALDEQARWTAHAIAAVVAVIDPGTVILGGGIGSREELVAPIRTWLDRLGVSGLDLRVSTLGSAAAVIGAVELARRSLTTHPSPLPEGARA